MNVSALRAYYSIFQCSRRRCWMSAWPLQCSNCSEPRLAVCRRCLAMVIVTRCHHDTAVSVHLRNWCPWWPWPEDPAHWCKQIASPGWGVNRVNTALWICFSARSDAFLWSSPGLQFHKWGFTNANDQWPWVSGPGPFREIYSQFLQGQFHATRQWVYVIMTARNLLSARP